MGKIADRLAHKKDPLYRVAREISKSLVELDAGDYGYLDMAFEGFRAQLEVLEPDDFERLIFLVHRSLESRSNGGELEDQMWHVLDALCETSEDEEGATTGVLATVSLTLKGLVPAWELQLPEQWGAALAATLTEFDMVEDATDIIVLPRLLGAVELSAWKVAQVYRLRKALEAGDVGGACKLVDQVRKQLDAVTQPSKVEALSQGIAVVFVRTRDDEPFALARDYDFALEDLGDDIEDEASTTAEAAHADLQAVLDAAAEKLSDTLSMQSHSISFIGPLCNYSRGLAEAAEFNRSLHAHSQLNVVRDKAGLPGAAPLFCGEPQVSDSGAPELRISLHTSPNGASTGMLNWPALPWEGVDETFVSLTEFLARDDIEPIGNAVPASAAKPSRRQGGALLH